MTEVFAGPLAGGDHVVLFFNRNASAPTAVSVHWDDLGIAGGTKMKARDLWYRDRHSYPAHDWALSFEVSLALYSWLLTTGRFRSESSWLLKHVHVLLCWLATGKGRICRGPSARI